MNNIQGIRYRGANGADFIGVTNWPRQVQPMPTVVPTLSGYGLGAIDVGGMAAVGVGLLAVGLLSIFVIKQFKKRRR